jgi:PadR family transcriptional regulator
MGNYPAKVSCERVIHRICLPARWGPRPQQTIMPPKTPNALLHGTLDALILKTLAGGPLHGYAIARFIEDTTGEAVLVEEGSLYPALYRMERRGWVEAEWGTSELGRRAKLYRLTDAGRVQLTAETATWRRFSAGVSKVLFAR